MSNCSWSRRYGDEPRRVRYSDGDEILPEICFEFQRGLGKGKFESCRQFSLPWKASIEVETLSPMLQMQWPVAAVFRTHIGLDRKDQWR